VTYAHPTIEEIAQRRTQLAPFDGWNERAFCQLVAWMGVPRRYLDLGSGTGAMVNMARKIGVEAYGVDVINGPEHWFIAHDLTEPLDFVRMDLHDERLFNRHTMTAVALAYLTDDAVRFDLVTCFEVGEHLPLDTHTVLCDTIARHLAPEGTLIFSAAPPGQAGDHHIGCRPAHEWRSLFYERGISYREDYTRQLAHLIGWVSGPVSHWLAANLMVFDTA
jgi:SAM-dependent methyltransferase